LDRRLGGPQSRSGRGDEEENSQPPPEIEPLIVQTVAQRCTAELSRLLEIFTAKGTLLIHIIKMKLFTASIPPFPQYVFMAWYLVKHRESFTFYLSLCKRMENYISSYFFEYLSYVNNLKRCRSLSDLTLYARD
jgi:hypothetical protein